MNEYLVGGVISIEKYAVGFNCGSVPEINFKFSLKLETLSDLILLRNYFSSKKILPYEFANLFFLKNLKMMRRKRRRLKSKVQLSSDNIPIGVISRSEYYDIALDLYVIDENLFMNYLVEFCDRYKFLLVNYSPITDNAIVSYFPKGIIPSLNPYI